MSFAMKYLLCVVALAFAADIRLGEPALLYGALYHAVFLFFQLNTDGFAYTNPSTTPDAHYTVNPATGLPMSSPGENYGIDIGGNLYGTAPHSFGDSIIEAVPGHDIGC